MSYVELTGSRYSENFKNYQIRSVSVGEYEANFFSLTKPANAHKTPVILLGGAFHTLKSQSYYAEELAKDSPVYVVELPGLGTNNSFRKSGFLPSEQSKHLKAFMDATGIDRVMIVAFSYMTPVAQHFASSYPDLVERLILNGAISVVRPTVRLLLEEALTFLESGNVEKFSSTMALTLINFSKKELVINSKEIRRQIYSTFLSSSQTDLERVACIINSMLKFEAAPRAPYVDTLFICGEYDNLVVPYESYQISSRYPYSTFVILRGADHLASLEQNEVMGRLFRRYFQELPLNRMKDVDQLDASEFPKDKIQQQPRYSLNDIAYLDSGNGVYIPINIVDINTFGCRIYTSFTGHKSFKEKSKFTLYIPKENVQMGVTFFQEMEGGHFRGIFRHQSFDKTNHFNGYINRIASGHKESLLKTA